MALSMHCAHSRTEANCHCDVSFDRPSITSRPRTRSYTSRERKLWFKKFKIKCFASGCDEIWDSRSIEGKDKLSTNKTQTQCVIFTSIFVQKWHLRRILFIFIHSPTNSHGVWAASDYISSNLKARFVRSEQRPQIVKEFGESAASEHVSQSLSLN